MASTNNSIKIMIGENTYQYNVTESYQSLTPKQFKKALKLFTKGHVLKRKRASLLSKVGGWQKTYRKFRHADHMFIERIMLFRLLTGMPKEVFVKLKFLHVLQLIQSVDWFGDMSEINLPESKVKRFLGVKGPQDYLATSTMEKLDEIDQIAKQYTQSSAIEAVNYMVAMVYPIAGISHESFLFKVWLWIVSKTPLHKRLSAFFNIMGLRNNFKKRYPLVHSENQEQGKVNHYQFTGVVVALAGEKFGSPDDVRKTKANDCFVYMEDAREEQLLNKK